MPVELAPDVVREIVLYAAQTSTSSCRTLCEVSIWVRQLALPFLYTIISLDDRNLDAFVRLVTSPSLVYPPSPTFRPTDTVRYLWVVSMSLRPMHTIITRCKKATHFAFTRIGLSALSAAIDPEVSYIGAEGGEGDREEVDMEEGALHVTLLNNGTHGGWQLFDEGLMFRPDQPLYRRLRSVRFESPINLENSLSLDTLVGLTHFAASSETATEGELNNIFDIIMQSSLEVFVLVFTDEQMDGEQRQQIDAWVCNAHMQDTRIQAVTPLFDDSYLEWKAEVEGGATIWERAVEYTRLLMSRT